MFLIHKPLWNGNKQRCVGLADYRLALEGNIVEIQIDYKSQEGLRLYPNPFYIRKVDAVKYPPQNASGTKVYVVPICNLSTTPSMDKKYVEYNLDCPKCNVDMRQNLNGIMVSYVCEKCGAVSNIEWELGKPTLESKPSDEPAPDTEPIPDADDIEPLPLPPQKIDLSQRSSKKDNKEQLHML
jgi:hypothetical protein